MDSIGKLRPLLIRSESQDLECCQRQIHSDRELGDWKAVAVYHPSLPISRAGWAPVKSTLRTCFIGVITQLSVGPIYQFTLPLLKPSYRVV